MPSTLVDTTQASGSGNLPSVLGAQLQPGVGADVGRGVAGQLPLHPDLAGLEGTSVLPSLSPLLFRRL